MDYDAEDGQHPAAQGSVPSRETVEYLTQMIGELRTMAVRSGLRDLGYLLAVAEVEARERLKDIQVS